MSRQLLLTFDSFFRKIFHITDLNVMVANIVKQDCMYCSTYLPAFPDWSSDRFLNLYFPSKKEMSSYLISLAAIFMPFLFVDDNVDVFVNVNEFLFSYHLVLVRKKSR